MNIPAIYVSTNIPIPKSITNNQKYHHHRPRKSKPLSTEISQLNESLNLNGSPSSYAGFLSACIAQKSILPGQKLYLHLLLNHPDTVLQDPLILSKLITLFSTSPDHLEEAALVLHHALWATRSKSVHESLWATLLAGYIHNGYPARALCLFCQMLARRVHLSDSTVSLIVKAFALIQDFRFGKSVHAQMLKSQKELHGLLYHALMGFYDDFGSFGEVCKVFESMPNRTIESWDMMIDRFVEKDKVLEAFAAFRRMIREGILFDWNGLLTVLNRSRCMILLNVVKEIHARMMRSDDDADVDALNALLDMYANCGEMEYSMKVFNGMETKDLMSWNNVLNGYAINGCMEVVTELFQGMLECGITPDRLTFKALLTGCSHSGLIKEGQVLFDRMRNEFQIEPDLEHYECLVDIYGKGGRIDEALEMVKLMPEEPSDDIYGALLNSCRLHGNVTLAEVIFQQIFEVGPNNYKNYITMCNTYADAGMWEGVNRVRGIMEKSRIQSDSMCTWIQIRDQVYMFMEGGGFKPFNSSEFKKLWDELNEEGDREAFVHGSIDNGREEWVCGHSERIATVFGLIHCAPRIPLRIVKNYLVCKACHSWMMNVSKVTRREIIMRDTYQFHHFHEGQCRCSEYWCKGQ